MLVYQSLTLCFLVFVSASSLKNLPIQKYPYVASIESDNQYLGGAAILSRHFALTYGWTVLNKLSEIKGGLVSVRTGSNFSKKNGGVHTVCNYSMILQSSTLVVLLQLADPINFNKSRQPIRLFDTADKVKPGMNVTLSAWANLKSARIDSPKLKIFKGVVKENCSELNTFGSGVFCIDTPSGMYDSLGQGHPVEIDGMLAGIVVISKKGETTIIDVPTCSDWIKREMKKTATGGVLTVSWNEILPNGRRIGEDY